jgi:hypothetical protein
MNWIGLLAGFTFLVTIIAAAALWLIANYYRVKFRISVRPSSSFSPIEINDAAKLPYALYRKWARRAAICTIIMITSGIVMHLSGFGQP